MARQSKEEVEAEIALLGGLSLAALKARWLELKGTPLPKFMRRGLMAKAVAHAIRESAFGGLDPATQKTLEQAIRQIVPSGQKPAPAANKIKAGTRLLREWRGRVHEVTVAADGFVWNGKRHRSLSEIARLITGTRWNGWVFFGLKLVGGVTANATPVPTRKRGGRGSISGEQAHRVSLRSAAPSIPANRARMASNKISIRSMPSAKPARPTSRARSTRAG
jgi:hypothetical protein